MEQPERWLTCKDIAERLGIKRSSLWTYRSRQSFPLVLDKRGRTLGIAKSRLNEFIKTGAV